jgi:2-polyprenyl-3-methyl-5-hydroxy-6-metoxy-1,4-benzoquinol methylase
MAEPSRYLKQLQSYQQGGRALDIAMGSGRNAIFLAQNGYEVDGIEINRESIAICREQASQLNLRLNIIESDLEKTELGVDCYDLVICFFYLQRSLFPQIRAAIRPCGYVVYETFLIDQHIRYGSPRRKEFCLDHNELLHLF